MMPDCNIKIQPHMSSMVFFDLLFYQTIYKNGYFFFLFFFIQYNNK